jgi:hypothetical protein
MPRDRATVAAFAVIATGLAGTIVDPTGVIGVVLFGAAASAVLFLIARPLAWIRVGFSPARMPLLVSPRAIAVIAVAAGALLGATNLFDANGDAALGRILNDTAFLGGFALVATLALVVLNTAMRWVRTALRT